MTIQGYADLDATDLARLIARGELTALEVLEEAIERAERVNPQLNALVYPWFDHARTHVREGLPKGPLHGVPFLLKDLYEDYKGQPQSNGCRALAGTVGDHDAEMVVRYKAAGLNVFGRTTSPEFGLSTTTESELHGATRNPWNPELTSGGSSGGASSMVAAGVIPIANASDGGGSIRVPASCTGLFGLKPTRARNPVGPDVGEGWSGLATVHAISRSVRDSALLLDCTAGPDLGAPYWAEAPRRPFVAEVGRDVAGMRAAVIRDAWFGAETHPDCIDAVNAAAELCRGLGLEVEDADSSHTSRPCSTRTCRSSTATHARRSSFLNTALAVPVTEDDVEKNNLRMARQRSQHRCRLRTCLERNSRSRPPRGALLSRFRSSAYTDHAGPPHAARPALSLAGRRRGAMAGHHSHDCVYVGVQRIGKSRGLHPAPLERGRRSDRRPVRGTVRRRGGPVPYCLGARAGRSVGPSSAGHTCGLSVGIR